MPARRAGVVTFAGVLFTIVGVFTLIDGIAALTRPEQFYAVEDALIITDYDAWGILLVLFGLTEIVVGLGILNGSRTAQVAGVMFAMVGFITHLLLFKHYPAWSAAMMVVDVVVIYALTVYSDEFSRRVRF